MSQADNAPKEVTDAGESIYPGDFVLMYVVTSIGSGTQTEERVSKLTDDIEASPDYSDAESNLKEKAPAERTPTHYTLDLEMTINQEPGVPQLQTLGMADSENYLRNKGEQLECVRLYIYRDEPNSTATLAQVKEYYGVQFRIDSDTLPDEGYASFDVVGYVNGNEHGNVRFEKTVEAAP